jgi:hypothetical protein
MNFKVILKKLQNKSKSFYRGTILFTTVKLYKFLPFKIRNKLSKAHKLIYIKNKNIMKYSFVLGIFFAPFEYMVAGTFTYNMYTDHNCPKVKVTESDYKECLLGYNDVLNNRADNGSIAAFKKRGYQNKEPVFNKANTSDYSIISSGLINIDEELTDISFNVFREEGKNHNMILGIRENNFYSCYNQSKENKNVFYKEMYECVVSKI